MKSVVTSTGHSLFIAATQKQQRNPSASIRRLLHYARFQPFARFARLRRTYRRRAVGEQAGDVQQWSDNR